MTLSPGETPEEVREALEMQEELEAMRATVVRHDAARDWTVAEGRALHTRALNLAARFERHSQALKLAGRLGRMDPEAAAKAAALSAELAADAAALAADFSKWLSPGAQP